MEESFLEGIRRETRGTEPELANSSPGGFLSPEGQQRVAQIRGVHADNYSIPQASEMFRLAGGSWNISRNDDYNAELAANQGFGEQLLNTAIGGAYQYVAGFLDNFNYDLPDMAGMIGGEEKKYGSWLSDITKDIRKAGEAYPIYQEGDSFADPAYWAKQGQNLAYSGGLITGAFAEQIALTALTADTLGASAPLQAMALARKGNLLKSALFGAWKGVHEGYINGLETYNGTYENYLAKGKTQEEAIKAASNAASIGYRMEVGPLMALNALQFGLVGKYNPFTKGGQSLNQGFSGAIEGFGDVAFKNIKSKGLKTTAEFLTNAASEGFEEALQTGIGQYAQHKVEVQDGLAYGDLDLWNTEMVDSIVGGVLGGFLFGGLGTIKNGITKRNQEKSLGKDHDQFLANVSVRIKDHMTSLQEAQASGNKPLVEELETEMQMVNVFEALGMDYMNGKETAFDSYVSHLGAISEAFEKKDLEALKEFGYTIETMIPENKVSIDNAIAQAQRTKEILIKNFDLQTDADSAFEVSHKEMAIEGLYDLKEKSERKIEDFVSYNRELQEVSPETRQDALDFAEARSLEKVAMKGFLTQTQKSRIIELGKKQAESSQNPDLVIDYLNPSVYNDLTSLFSEKQDRVTKIKQASDRLNYWKDFDNQAKERKARLERQLNNAKSETQVDEVAKKMKEDGLVSQDLENELESKKATIRETEQGKSVDTGMDNLETLGTINNSGDITITQPSVEKAKALEDITSEFESLGVLTSGKTTKKPVFDKVEEDEILGVLSPSRLKKLTSEQKLLVRDRVSTYYEKLENEIGREPTFSEMLRDMLDNSKKDTVDRLFNVFTEGWKLNGYKETNFVKAYDGVFQTKVDLMSSMESEFGSLVEVDSDEKNIKQQEVSRVKEAIKESRETDEEGKPTATKDSKGNFKRSSPENHIAIKSIDSEELIILNDDGTISTREESGDEENVLVGKEVASWMWLDPEFGMVDQEFTVAPVENVDSTPVSVWDDKGWFLTHMTFGEWKNSKYGTTDVTNPAYINKIPMLISTKEGRPVAYVHDNDWYRTQRMALEDDPDAQKALIQDSKKNNLEIRKAALSKGSLTIKISSKSSGFFNVIPSDQPKVFLSESDPNSRLVVLKAGNRNEKGGQGNPLVNGVTPLETFGNILNLEDLEGSFEEGQTYELREMANKGDFRLFYVEQPYINETIQTSIINAIEIYNDPKLKDVGERFSSLNKGSFNIVDGIGTGLQSYLSQFIKFETISLLGNSPVAKAKFLEDEMDKKQNEKNGRRLKKGKKPLDPQPYVVMDGRKIYYGITGGKAGFINNEKAWSLNVFKKDILPKFRHNVLSSNTFGGLNVNRQVVHIDNQKNFVETGKDYNTHLHENLLTNIRGYKLPSGKYVTAVQPTVEFVISDTEVAQDQLIETIATKESEGKAMTREEAFVVNENKVIASRVEDKVTEKRKEVVEEIEQNLNTHPGVSQAEIDYHLTIVRLQQKKAGGIQEPVYKESVEFLTKAKQIIPVSKDDVLLSVSKAPENSPERKILGNIHGLEIAQADTIINYIFNKMSIAIDYNSDIKVPKKELIDNITEQILEGEFARQKDSIESILEVQRLNPNPSEATVKAIVENEELLKEFNKVTENFSTKGGFLELAYERLLLYTGLRETTESFTEELEDGTEKNYSVTSLEETTMDKSSYRLKRFLAGIVDVNKQGFPRRGHLGVARYVSFDTAYKTIQTVLNSPSKVGSNVDEVINRLSQNTEVYPWMSEVVQKLVDASLGKTDDRIPLELAYIMPRHSASFKFLMFSQYGEGKFSLKVYDSNSNDVIRVIKNSWFTNFKGVHTSLTHVIDGEYAFRKESVDRLLGQYNNEFLPLIENGQTPDYSKLQKWLKEFGIELSTETLSRLESKGLKSKSTSTTDKGYEYTKLLGMFKKSKNSNGIFGLLANHLESIKTLADNGGDLRFEVDGTEKNNPFQDAKGVLDSLARIESKYSHYVTPSTFRDNGKSISGLLAPTHSTDMVDRLKDYNPLEGFGDSLAQELSEKAFNGGSYMLSMLMNNEEFRKKFTLDQIGNTALKELNQQVFGNRDITSLPGADHQLAKTGFFQDSEQGDVNSRLVIDGVESPIGMRMARMFMPTMSDKSRMSMLYTAVLKIQKAHLGEGQVGMQQYLSDILIDQIIKPELARIQEFHSKGIKTNIKSYNFNAQFFHLIPSINKLMIEVDTKEGKRKVKLIEALATQPGTWSVDEVMRLLKGEFTKEVNKVVSSLVEKKIASWKEYGFVTEDEGGNTITKFMDSKYLNKLGESSDVDVKIRIAAHDFVINNLLTNANMFMLLAGDPALYKTAGKDMFLDGKPWNPLPQYKDTAYYLASSEVLGVDIGKRLAAMIAPGSNIVHEKGERYSQIFLGDFIDHSTNLDFLAKTLDKSTISGEEKLLVRKYNASKQGEAVLNNEEKEQLKKLEERLPKTSGYFSLEATDAQEYTTAMEHLKVVRGQGRISRKKFDILKSKIEKGQDLNPEELDMYFQPMKPVYTGVINDGSVMRMMYIKSSSFPLLPQVTRDFQDLDKLRQMLEGHEKRTGLSTRASYESANKVGANTNKVHPFKSDGSFNDFLLTERGIESLNASALKLHRRDFKIQQDVPFKAAKNKKDKVSLMTQSMKLLLGDGVTNMEGFEYQGETINGRELDKRFNENFDSLLELKQAQFYRELGNSNDVSQGKKKVQELLRKEAVDRGFPKQDVEALKFEAKLDSKGDIYYDFKLPIWMSANSNNYESLLNSIVSSRLIKLKMPGTSYVVGSEAGFRTTDTLSNLSKDTLSKVIFTSKWEGSLKAADFIEYINEDGTKAKRVKKAQVLVSSRMRDNEGNLIKLLFDDETPNEKYVEVKDGKFMLKEDMISPEMLTMFSARIPTSSHVSMSELDIVGFLPPQAADLLIVPKNFTKQKGLDFDIDKETTYYYNHKVDDTGRVGRTDYLYSQELSKSTEVLQGRIADIQARIEEVKLERKDLYDTLELLEDDLTNEELELTEEQKKEYLDSKEELKEELKDDKFTKSYLKFLKETLSDSRDDLEQVLQNRFIEAHKSVASHPEMAERINKVLSMDFAKAQSEVLSSISNDNTDYDSFSILSDEYQMGKMELGASGKLGIGVYSNAVVFNSLVNRNLEPIHVTELYEFINASGNREKSVRNMGMFLGSQESDGRLGRKKTLGEGLLNRNLSEVLAERQNTATDNEKEQIMGKVNVNDLTINVDTLLVMLGFDKDDLFYLEYYDPDGKTNVKSTYSSKSKMDQAKAEAFRNAKNGVPRIIHETTQVSLPYAFLSQPIIKDYVRLTKIESSITKGFNANLQEEVVEKLKELYPLLDSAQQDGLEIQKRMNGRTLFDNITKPDNQIQNEVLSLFLKLDSKAKAVSELQKRLNLGSGGLGRSFFDVIEKYDFLSNMDSIFPIDVSNASSLFGDVIKLPINVPYNLIEEKEAEGYFYFEHRDLDRSGVLIKPTSIAGSTLVRSVYTAYNSWKGYFPYSNSMVLREIDSVVEEITGSNPSKDKISEARQKVFQDMKKFFVTHPKANFLGGKSVSVKRSELFIDNEMSGNESLASYLARVTKGEGLVSDYLRNNKLISSFEYTLNKNGIPSLIKYNNTGKESFDEEYLYIALLQMMEDNEPISTLNGKEYTSKDLANDLISYVYLGEFVQEAIQFGKYVPVSFLTNNGNGDMSSAKFFGMIDPNFRESLVKGLLGAKTDDFSRFAKQHIQHFPNKVNKVDFTRDYIDEESLQYLDEKDRKLEGVISFNIDPEITPKRILDAGYVSLYNKELDSRLKKKYQLYKRTGETTFTRVPVLGIFGMSEYDITKESPKSLVNANFETLQPSILQREMGVPEVVNPVDDFNIKSLSEHLIEIRENDKVSDSLRELAGIVLPNITPNMEIFKVDFRNRLPGSILAEGAFFPSTGEILMNAPIYDSFPPTEQARVMLHEVLHAMTVKTIDYYADASSHPTLKEGSPAEMQELLQVYNAAKREFGEAELKNFIGRYNSGSSGGAVESLDSDAYGLLNLREFNVALLTDKNFQKLMNVPYSKSGMTFTEKILDIANRLLHKVFGVDYDPNSITAAGVKAALALVEYQNKGKVGSETYFEKEAKQKMKENMETDRMEKELGLVEDSVNESKTDSLDQSHPIFRARREVLAYTNDQTVALNELTRFLSDNSSPKGGVLNAFLLAGYAGTGKTTIAENIFNYTGAHMTAPINNAVDRLRQKLGISESDPASSKFRTIHSLLYGEYDPTTGNPVPRADLEPGGVVLIDEASTMNDDLYQDIKSNLIDNGVKVIFMGDSFQLEPVGKNPSLFKKNFKGSFELKEVRRTDNSILQVATHLRNVQEKEVLKVENKEEFDGQVPGLEFNRRIIEDAKNDEDFVVLSSTNEKRMNWNNYIRSSRFGSKQAEQTPVMSGERLVAVSNGYRYKNGAQFKVSQAKLLKVHQGVMLPVKKTIGGQKVDVEEAQTLYEYEITNESGKTFTTLVYPNLQGASLYGAELANMKMFQSPNSSIANNYTSWDERKQKWRWKPQVEIATYGYALTTHKAIGGEWKNVYLEYGWLRDGISSTKLLYTGISRGRERVNISAAQVSKNIEFIDPVDKIPNLVESKDFIFNFDVRTNVLYTKVDGFPFSTGLIEKVKAGVQEITIRTNSDIKDGIHSVAGNKFLVQRIGEGPINVNYLLERGKTLEQVKQAFKGSDQIKEKSIQDWFEGKNERDVFFLKDVSDKLYNPDEANSISEVKDNVSKRDC